MNTSSNFVITAILGSVIFSEALPPLWWVGAALLVAGNVIVGRKDEGGPKNLDRDQSLTASVLASAGDGEMGPSSGARNKLTPQVEKDEDEDIIDLRSLDGSS
jgi:hypothetical protein